MKCTRKLMQFEDGVLGEISKITADLANLPPPEEIVRARNFMWYYSSGTIPKEEMVKYGEMVRKEGHEKADAWLDARRAAYMAELNRIRAVNTKIQEKGFGRIKPSDSQTINLLLRWALANAPKEILLPSAEDLCEIDFRTPSEDPPTRPKRKAPKATTSQR